jgi:hypothetical protein
VLQHCSTGKHGLSWSSTIFPADLARLLNNGTLKEGGTARLPMKINVGML